MRKAAALLLCATTLFATAARAEEANVNLVTREVIDGFDGYALSTAILQTDMTMSDCKNLAEKVSNGFYSSDIACLSKRGDMEVLGTKPISTGVFSSKNLIEWKTIKSPEIYKP
jgi:hypothetical protein